MTTYNFQPVTDFTATLEGATRLFWKGMKLINRYADIRLKPEDQQDGISAIYLAILEHTPGDEETPLPELSQDYFGIKSREQFRAGYNALQKMIYSNRTAAVPLYSQEYGVSGVAAKDELQEIEIEVTLQKLLPPIFLEVLELRMQGYTIEEIGEETDTPIGTVKWFLSDIRKILQAAFEVDTTERKKPRIRKR